MSLAAAELSMRGLRVFALAPGAKYPAASGWQAAATDDPLTALETIPDDGNVGICTDGLLVIDVDAGKGGLEALAELRKRGTLPETFTVRSARGGLHLYYRPANGERFRSRSHRKSKDDRGNDREVFALEGFAGIDTRADGGLTVGPGSQFGGQPYKIETDAPIAELPEFVAELARRAAPRLAAVAGVTIGEADQPDAIHRATVYLLSASPSVEGEAGDPHLIVVANRVMDFGITPETCAALMLEHWNDRCTPAWDADRLLYKCQSAARGRQKPIGSENFDTYFSAVEPMPYTPPAALPMPSLSALVKYPHEMSIAAVIASQNNDFVKHILGPGELSVLYGPSGGGKSFVALHLAYALARGVAWCGLKTKQTLVVYASGEGARGLEKRVLVAEREYGAAGKWFAAVRAPALLSRGERGDRDLAKLMHTIREAKAAVGAERVLVIIDTLARAMAGEDENSAEAMTALVELRAGVIQRELGAHVQFVHHTNKAGSIRGSSALFAAADAVMQLTRDGAARSLRAEKVKDGDEIDLCAFTLQPINLGIDADGETVTSCAVELGQTDTQRKCEGAVTDILGAALDAGERLSPSKHAKNYAGKWLFEHQGNYSYSEGEISAALERLVPWPFEVEGADNKGRTAKVLKRADKIV
jgi:hypothetical protein